MSAAAAFPLMPAARARTTRDAAGLTRSTPGSRIGATLRYGQGGFLPSASRHQLAAIDLDDLADDVAAQSLRRQEQIGADAILGSPEPGGGNGLANRLQSLRSRIAIVKRRRNHARGNRVDANLLVDQLLGVAAGDRRDEAFGRCI